MIKGIKGYIFDGLTFYEKKEFLHNSPKDSFVEATAYLGDVWIDINEQLPPTKGLFLVAYHPCYWKKVEPTLEVGFDSHRGNGHWARNKYQKVTHWQPLPIPPYIEEKAEEETKNDNNYKFIIDCEPIGAEKGKNAKEVEKTLEERKIK